MSFARAGKTAANEAKYPFIVEVPVAANGLNVEFEQSNCRFSQVVPRHAAIWTHCTPRRANLLPLVLFRFGDGARLCRTVWRSILQNNRHLTYAGSHNEGAADRGVLFPKWPIRQARDSAKCQSSGAALGSQA
jgi:hypothetical protein